MRYLHRWRRPRTFSYVALVGSLVAITSAVAALGDGRADAWLPGKMTWAGLTYAGLTTQTRVVVGIALVACLAGAVVDPQNGLLAATAVLCAQRVGQNLITDTPSLFAIVLYAGWIVLAVRDTARIRHIVESGGSP